MMEGETGSTEKVMEKLNEVKNVIAKYAFMLMPYVARLFLMGTFLDDGLRMLLQYDMQIDYINRSWGIHAIFAHGFVVCNMVGQLGSCVLLLLNKHEIVACIILYVLILLQIIIYNLAYVPAYLMRNLALVGAVTMLLAASQVKDLWDPQLPSLGKENHRKTISQLLGRILLVLMFLTLIHFEHSVARIVESVVGAVLLVLIVVGYKTKEASLLLSLWLYVLNFYENSWWTLPESRKDQAETLKFDFFQTLSVTGGFLLVVSLGPGRISLDELKKKE